MITSRKSRSHEKCKFLKEVSWALPAQSVSSARSPEPHNVLRAPAFAVPEIYVELFKYVCMHVHMQACMHACPHNVCVYMYPCEYVCIYIYIYVYVCVYVYVCIGRSRGGPVGTGCSVVATCQSQQTRCLLSGRLNIAPLVVCNSVTT